MADKTAPRATSNRSTTPLSETFTQYISSQWADRPDALPAPRAHSAFAARRRARISAAHPGKLLIVPAGAAKTRSNDTDYPYRAHSAFTYLTGWGSDSVAGSVLVLEPTAALSLAELELDDRDLVLVVGPEGGIAPQELEALASAGASIVRLGPEVLRTSTAGPAALAALNVALGRW